MHKILIVPRLIEHLPGRLLESMFVLARQLQIGWYRFKRGAFHRIRLRRSFKLKIMAIIDLRVVRR